MVELHHKVKRSTIVTFPIQIAINVLGVLFTILLARLLTVEEFGIYNLLAGSLIIFSYFCNYGLASSLQRYVPEYAGTKQYRKAFQLIKFSHVFRAATSLLLFILAILTFDVWAPKFGLSSYYLEFCILSISAILLFQIEYFQVDFSSLFHHGYLLLTLLLVVTIKILLSYVLLVSGQNVLGVFASELVANLVGFSILVYLLLKIIRRKNTSLGEYLVKADKKKITRYSIFNALIGPGAILYSNSIDYLVVAYYANPLQLGVYALSSRFSKMILTVMPHNILQSVIRPAFYHQYSIATDKNSALNNMFGRLVTMISFFIVPVLFLMIIAAELFITSIFGNKYSESVLIFQVLVFCNLFVVLEVPSDLVLQAIEMPEARLYAQVFAIYNVVMAVVLMPIVGIIGVAIATGTATILRCLFLYILCVKHAQVKIRVRQLISIILYSTISLTPFFIALLMNAGVIILSVLLVLSVVIYLSASIYVPFLDDSEKNIVNSYLNKEVFNV